MLALSGLVTMRIAEGIAKNEGVELLNETASDSDDYIFTYEYEADSVGKISVNVKNAKVNVIGTSAKSYIELINFPEGTYEFTSSNRIITINNNSDFSSISSIASMALNFKGLRSIVNYINVSGREKMVNIYLSEDFPVKVIDCKVQTGEVLIEKCSSQTDYNIEIGTGVLSINNINTSSVVNATLETGDVLIENCFIGNLAANVGTGDIGIITSDIVNITTELENGDFSYGYRYDIAFINLDLSAGVGTVRINGEDKGGYYDLTDLPTNAKYIITLGKGDIIINSNMTADQ